MTMRRSFLRWWAGLLGLSVLVSGCGYDPFAPPKRTKSTPLITEATPSKPNFLVYVVPSVPVGDLEVWGVRAQQEANLSRAIFRIMGPAPDQTPVEQPEIVRKALADGASALIVYPGDSPELPKVLAEAEAKGVPVVLIDKTIPAPEGAKPFTVVEPQKFEETAKQIVSKTIEDLKNASKPINGTAIVLADKVVDRTSAARVAALKGAAEAAKFRQVLTVPFDGSVEDSAKKAVLDIIKGNPDVSVVLCDDAEGLMGASVARVDAKGKPTFFVAGYTDYRTSKIFQAPVRESCYVEGRYAELGGMAVVMALAKLRGESVEPHNYLIPRFNKGTGDVSTETVSNSSLPETRKSENLGDILKDIKPPEKDAKP